MPARDRIPGKNTNKIRKAALPMVPFFFFPMRRAREIFAGYFGLLCSIAPNSSSLVI
jgi:hypothetical protein